MRTLHLAEGGAQYLVGGNSFLFSHKYFASDRSAILNKAMDLMSTCWQISQAFLRSFETSLNLLTPQWNKAKSLHGKILQKSETRSRLASL